MFNNSDGTGRSKKKTVVLVVAVAIALIAILVAVFVTTSNTPGLSKKKAIEGLTTLRDESVDFEGYLSDIYGGTVNINSVSPNNVDQLVEQFKSIKEQCIKICDYSSVTSANKEQNEQFVATITEIKRRVAVYEPGVQMLSDFNTAFFRKIYEFQYEMPATGKIEFDKALKWEHNEQAIKLLENDNETIRSVAKQLDDYINRNISVVNELRNCGQTQPTSQTCTDLAISLTITDRNRKVSDKNWLLDISTGFRSDSIVDYVNQKYLGSLIQITLVELE